MLDPETADEVDARYLAELAGPWGAVASALYERWKKMIDFDAADVDDDLVWGVPAALEHARECFDALEKFVNDERSGIWSRTMAHRDAMTQAKIWKEDTD